MIKKLTTIVAILLCGSTIAQDVDLFKMLDEESKQEDAKRTNYATATFKTTRLINGHSVENVGKGILDFKISHRFNPISDGPKEAWGFDHASMRIGLDYGLTDRLMIGLGRSTFQKQIDGFLKYKLLRQSSGYRTMPVTVSVLASVMMRNPLNDSIANPHFSDKLYYCLQLLVGRKLSEATSIQVMPTVIHRNIVSKVSQSNDNYAIGVGGRQKISKRVSINAEYYYVLPNYKVPNTYNSLSVGVDIETGGHVFQLHFSNSMGMTERTFITETDGQWGEGDIHFGFNIARVFTIGKKNKANKMKLREPGT